MIPVKSPALRVLQLVMVCVITVTLIRNTFLHTNSTSALGWHSNCKESLLRAELALLNPARPTQTAQRIRDLPDEYRNANTRDVVHFIVSNWSAREDLQSAFASASGELDGTAMEAMVRWTRDGVDSTAVALVPCAAMLAKLPGEPSEQSAIPGIVRWARGRVRWQPEVDNAAYAAADFIRTDPALVKAARIDPAKAILAAASVRVKDPAYQALWTYQSMFDVLLKAKP
jgi:hypothetical protein